jgi:cyclic-di-GMP phosphodiesterase TipF (flagellum assembly factor)
MARLGAIFIVVCMVLIAGAVGILLFLVFGLSGPEAAVVAIGALTALALYDAVAKQLRHRALVNDQIANLSQGTADLAWQVGDLTRRVGELSHRVTVIERNAKASIDRERTAGSPFVAELNELGTIVKHLAETVTAHGAALAGQHPQASEETPAIPTDALNIIDRGEFDLPEFKASTDTNAQLKTIDHDQMIATIRAALDDNRVDLYLQPIVTLPQRKVRYYESLSRLRNEDGRLLLPADFLAAAESSGLMPRVDHLILSRSARVARRLLQKNRTIGLICNVSVSTLVDPQACQQLLQFLEANRTLAPALVLEFTQSAWRAMGPIERESLAALAEYGFRFSMDHVTDLHIEPRDLAGRGIRFIKVQAKLLLEPADTLGFDIHPADFPDLLARFGIGLIAEQIENESTAIDLLECQVKFGQGFLFSPPRPVRAEALQGIAEDAPATERASADKPREPALTQRTLAKAVEGIRHAGILSQPASDGSRA